MPCEDLGSFRVYARPRKIGNVGDSEGMEVYHATQDVPGLYTPRLPF